MGTTDRFATVIAAIDAANAADPNTIGIDGAPRPKELVHSDMVGAWVERLRPDASEALRIAARGHHLRRWTIPRATYPPGRSGYLRWRRALQDQHARELAEIMSACGYDESTSDRVQRIVRKSGLGHDDEVQTFEDALCLVFLETQLAEIASRLDEEKLVDVLRRSAAKMSPAGREAARSLPLAPAHAQLLVQALAALEHPT